MEFEDFFFDGFFGNEAIYRDGALLPDAVRAVSSLVFYRRIPPGIEMNDIIGSRKIQTHATSFQANQEQIAFAALESINAFLAFMGLRAAVQVLIVDFFVF